MQRRALLLSTAVAGDAGSPALPSPPPTGSASSPRSRSSPTWSATVGGEHVDVTALIGPNADAHAFEPSPADAKALATAHSWS